MSLLSICRILFALVCTCAVQKGAAQTQLEETKNEVLEKIINFQGNSDLISSDSTFIVWHQIDTFKFVRYTSAIRDFPKHDTLEITLRFESGWNDSTLVETKRNNTRLIEKHKVKFIHFMDSINWRGYKISKSWFESEPVVFLKMNYPVIFSDDEFKEIKSIKRCPDYRVGSIGVFLDCNHLGIDPVEVQDRFTENLRFISEDVFETEEIAYRVKIYQ